MPVLNRRDLVRSSALLAVGGLISARAQDVTAPHTPPKKVTYTPVNVDTFHAAGTVHSLAVASLLRGNATAQDYHNAAAGLSMLHTNWVGAGLDSTLVPGVNRLNEGDLTVARMGSNLTWATNNIKSFNPAVTQTQIESALNNTLANCVIDGQDYRTLMLNKMRAGQGSLIVAGGISAFNAMATAVPVPKISPTTHTYVPQIYLPPTGGSGGNGGDTDDCDNLDTAAVALAIVGVVLTVMTDGLDLLAAAAWEAVTYWAGLSSAGLAVEHKLLC